MLVVKQQLSAVILHNLKRTLLYITIEAVFTRQPFMHK